MHKTNKKTKICNILVTLFHHYQEILQISVFLFVFILKFQDNIFQSLFSVLFCPTLVEFRLMLSVILLSVLVTFLFTLNEIGFVICDINLSWFLNLDTVGSDKKWLIYLKLGKLKLIHCYIILL